MLQIVNLLKQMIVIDRTRRAELRAERETRRAEAEYQRQQQLRIDLPRPEVDTCRDCGGSGTCGVCAGRPVAYADDERPETCSACGGSARCISCGGNGTSR
jgi:hypothetical protein